MFSDYYNKGRIIKYKIYDFKSDSQRALCVTLDWREPHPRRECIPPPREGLSLKGNIYFVGQRNMKGGEVKFEDFLLSFDFTRERFGHALLCHFGLIVMIL